MFTFRFRRRMGLLLGLLVCSLGGVQFFSFSLGSFERTAKDFPNRALHTSLDAWNFDARNTNLGSSSLAKNSLPSRNIGLDTRTDNGEGFSVSGEKTRTLQQDDEEAQTSTEIKPPLKRFSKVSPALLQEEKCPGCYGTTLCDKFYAGNITLDMETPGMAKDKGVFFGHMEGRRIVAKRLADVHEFKRLDHFVCQNSSRRNHPNLPCDVSWDILHSHLASRMALDVEYIRKDAHKVARTAEASLSLALCASDRFINLLKELYGLKKWNRDYSPEIATLMTSLLLNPEGLLLRFFKRYVPELQKYFPSYLGECGRMIVVAEAGKPLVEFRSASWDIRSNLSRQILQMIRDFQEASSDWLVIFSDFDYENFAVTADGQLQLLDLEDILIIDKQEMLPAERLSSLAPPCNEECFSAFVKNLYQSGGRDCAHASRHSQVMLMLACHKLLSDLESTKYLRFFYPEDHKQEPTVGLLHDIPDMLEPNLSNLLYNCVFESTAGQRIQSANILKRLLEATSQGHLQR